MANGILIEPTTTNVYVFDRYVGDDDDADWDGNSCVTFANDAWKLPLWEMVWLVDQMVETVSLVRRKILQVLGLRQEFKHANELIRYAPLLAALLLGNFVSTWRKLPAKFPLSNATGGRNSLDDDDSDSGGDDDDDSGSTTHDDTSGHNSEANGSDE